MIYEKRNFKLDSESLEEYDETPFNWIGHPDLLEDKNSYGREKSDKYLLLIKKLVDRRPDIIIIAGIHDPEKCYSYNELALCKLDSDYYLLSTEGCSCPSPTETWKIEKGPATLEEIKSHLVNGDYEGCTFDDELIDPFLQIIDEEIEKCRNQKLLLND